MAKTKEELNQLKIEFETLNNKLKELSEDELKQVTGGDNNPIDINGLESIGPYAAGSVNVNEVLTNKNPSSDNPSKVGYGWLDSGKPDD